MTHFNSTPLMCNLVGFKPMAWPCASIKIAYVEIRRVGGIDLD